MDGPDFEGRDVRALITFVANQPEARLDSAGDPKLGMAGGSYGGGIQLVTAGLDTRVDAIVPDIAWQSLITSLYKDDNLKMGWGSLLTARRQRDRPAGQPDQLRVHPGLGHRQDPRERAPVVRQPRARAPRW